MFQMKRVLRWGTGSRVVLLNGHSASNSFIGLDRRSSTRSVRLHTIRHSHLNFTSYASSSDAPLTVKKSRSRKRKKTSSAGGPEWLVDQVMWYEWGPEAFEKAEAEKKLVFLSVMSSASHWSDLMYRDCFQNPAIAKVLNEHFIPIKVDRDERPDIDHFYSVYIQKTLGEISWPLTVFLTSSLGPVYGMTYLPAFTKDGTPSFSEMIEDMMDGWKKSRTAVMNTGNGSKQEIRRELVEKLDAKTFMKVEERTFVVEDMMIGCVAALADDFDEKYGGFGHREKFPRTSSLKLIQREFVRRGDMADYATLSSLLKMLLYSIGAMHDGGIHDHIGGGFHTSAIDRIWHVPQFEKRLVDNVQIAQSYLSAALILPERKWFSTVRSTLDFLLRELRSEDGGFYAALSADSYDSASESILEGAFYTWSKSAIDAVLSPEESAVFCDYYNVLDEGNCVLAHPDRKKGYSTNCLVIQRRLDDMADKHELSEAEISQLLTECRKKLFEARSRRTKPQVDDRIFAGYNGLAMSVFSEAGRALLAEETSGEPIFPVTTTDPAIYLKAAVEIGECILKHLWNNKKKTLRHFYQERDKKKSMSGLPEDYALVIAGFLDLYSSTGERSWLEWALKLQDKMDELFWDAKEWGYFSTWDEHPCTPLEMKYCFDDGIPSAQSIAVSNVLRMTGYVEDHAKYILAAKKIVELCALYYTDHTLRLSEFAASLFFVEERPESLKIVVIGDAKSDDVGEYLNALHSVYAPSKTLVVIDPLDNASLEFWKGIAPQLMSDLENDINRMKEGKDEAPSPAVYVCNKLECIGPLENAAKLTELLQFSIEEEERPTTDTIESVNRTFSKYATGQKTQIATPIN